jgi:hypothetical protein
MAKKAAILYQGSTFKASAMTAQTFLKECAFHVVRCLPFDEPSTLDNLPTFPTVDLMVWYAHGGWDGPMVFQDLSTEFPDQISPSESTEWARLMTYFRGQLGPRGMFIAHCCHSAGSDLWERRRDKSLGFREPRVWVRDIARSMNVYAVGQAGSAGAANPQTVKALLEYAVLGTSHAGYPFRAYAPGGAPVILRGMGATCSAG